MYKGINYNERPSYPRPPAPPNPPQVAAKAVPATVETLACSVHIVGHNAHKTNRLSYSLAKTLPNKSGVVSVHGYDRASLNTDDDRWPWNLYNKIELNSAASNRQLIILNLYDHRPGHGGTQEKVFDSLWRLYKSFKDVDLIVIGSLASHHSSIPGIPDEYIRSKRSLREKVVACCREPDFRCRVLLFEPGVIESQLPKWPTRYFKNHEVSDLIYNLALANKNTMFVTASGSHMWDFSPVSP